MSYLSNPGGVGGLFPNLSDSIDKRRRRRAYARDVQRMAEALHDDCRLEWQAIKAVDPSRQVTVHEADAHLGKAHDLVRRLARKESE